MRYAVRVRRRVKNLRVYTITKRLGPKENFMTRLFTKMLTKGSKGQDKQ
ncbi:MAG: hypothetical protein M1474_00020 [Candidatus Marsarchaeota archaeon]|jgi:hypothetical protein|nr:hypothetical protein [Candidatus Marsarchaeota archaeon]